MAKTKSAAPKKIKAEKLKLLVSLLAPEGSKARAVIDRIKELLEGEFPEQLSVRKAPATKAPGA